MLELDHVFCFCESQLPELQKVEEMGFSVYPTRTHQGQGTANRCILFQENYLELIYLSSKEDSLKNPLKLYKRAEWKETAASPFGIALRGNIPDEHKNEFWEYRPSYSPNQTIYIHKFNEQHPRGPPSFRDAFTPWSFNGGHETGDVDADRSEPYKTQIRDHQDSSD